MSIMVGAAARAITRPAIQSLTLTVGVSAEQVRVLDALRKQRNLTDCSGDLAPDYERMREQRDGTVRARKRVAACEQAGAVVSGDEPGPVTT